MNDAPEFLCCKQRLNSTAVGQIHLNKPKILVLLQHAEPRSLQARVIIIVKVIKSDDLVASSQQPLRHEKSDESGCTGNQDLHTGLQSPIGLVGGKQVFHVVKHMLFLCPSADFTDAHRLEFIVPDSEHDGIVAGKLGHSDGAKRIFEIRPVSVDPGIVNIDVGIEALQLVEY